MGDILVRVQAALAERYTVHRELGSGGMATVYLAHDLRQDRAVALKVLRPELAQALGPERFLAVIRSWQPGFRGLLCGQIAKIVATVNRRAGEALIIEFEDSSSLSISLRAEDYETEEAYYAHGFKDGAWNVE